MSSISQNEILKDFAKAENALQNAEYDLETDISEDDAKEHIIKARLFLQTTK